MSILTGQTENRFLTQVGVELLAVNEVGLTSLVESDSHLKDEKKVVSGRANAPQDFGNVVGLRQGVVDRVA